MAKNRKTGDDFAKFQRNFEDGGVPAVNAAALLTPRVPEPAGGGDFPQEGSDVGGEGEHLSPVVGIVTNDSVFAPLSAEQLAMMSPQVRKEYEDSLWEAKKAAWVRMYPDCA